MRGHSREKGLFGTDLSMKEKIERERERMVLDLSLHYMIERYYGMRVEEKGGSLLLQPVIPFSF